MWTVDRAIQPAVEKSGLCLPGNWEPKNLHLFIFFNDLETANIFWTQQDIANRASTVESTTTRWPLHSPRISWTLVHKQLKIGPEFLPTLSILFHPQSITHPLSSINAVPTVTVNDMAFGLSSAQIRRLKRC